MEAYVNSIKLKQYESVKMSARVNLIKHKGKYQPLELTLIAEWF